MRQQAIQHHVFSKLVVLGQQTTYSRARWLEGRLSTALGGQFFSVRKPFFFVFAAILGPVFGAGNGTSFWDLLIVA